MLWRMTIFLLSCFVSVFELERKLIFKSFVKILSVGYRNRFMCVLTLTMGGGYVVCFVKNTCWE